MFGFYSSKLPVFPRLKSFPLRVYELARKLATIIFIISAIGAVYSFYKVGGIPVLGNNQLRVDLFQSIGWNLFILGNFSLFLCAHYKIPTIGSLFFAVLLIIAFLSGWKGAVLGIVLAFFAPKLKHTSLGFWKVVFSFLIVFIIFFLINYLRNRSVLDVVTLSGYIYWGFLNFDQLAVDYSSNCFLTLDAFNAFSERCAFKYSELQNPTWNVFTALTPIYIDFGYIGICLFFFFVGLVYGLSVKSNSVLSNYLFFSLSYFLLIAHNVFLFKSLSMFVMLIGALVFLFLENIFKYNQASRNL